MSDTTEVHPGSDAPTTAADPNSAAGPPVLSEGPAEPSRVATPVPGGVAPGTVDADSSGDGSGERPDPPEDAAGAPGEAGRPRRPRPLWRRIVAYGTIARAGLRRFSAV